MEPLIYSVEDDKNIQNVLQIALTNSNYRVRTFEHANELFQALSEELPDLILLDIMLPDMDGLAILKQVKTDAKLASIPIMIISAKVSEIDKVIGLDTGADDYLIKPFGVLELVSRVKALLRRRQEKQKTNQIQIQELFIDAQKYICRYGKTEISFTKKQFDLLHLLMLNHGNTLSRDHILNTIWGYEYIGETRTLDVHIKEIRRKLTDSGLQEKAIETIRGIGYRFIL